MRHVLSLIPLLATAIERVCKGKSWASHQNVATYGKLVW